MTEPVARTPFLRKLDEANLEQVKQRLTVLEPLVAEHKELIARRRLLEARLGVVTRTERVRRLLAEHPRGLTRAAIGDQLDLSNALSGVLGELKRQAHVEQPARGLYRLTDAGHAATRQEVAQAPPT